MSGSRPAAAGIGLSRVAGLVREVAIGAVLGAGLQGDAFRAAMRVPNLLQNLLGEGALSASFVPVYAKLLEERADVDARRVANGVLGLLGLLIVAIAALFIVAARPLAIALTFGGFSGERLDLTVSLMRLTTVGIAFLALSAWCIGILNANRQYFRAYVAPVVWSAAQILALAVAAIGGFDDTRTVWLLAAAMVLGSVAQVAVQWPVVTTLVGGVVPHIRRDGDVRRVIDRFVPAVGARGVVQVSSWIDLGLAGLLAKGSVAMLALAAPLHILPVSVFGFSIAAAELTEMSRASDRIDRVGQRVRLGLRRVLLPAGLCTAALVAGGSAIAGTLYAVPNDLIGRDSLSSDQAIVIGWTLGAFALGLPATMRARISQNALYALGDVTGPARVAVVRLVVAVVISVTVMFPMERLVWVDGALTGLGELDIGMLFSPLDSTARELAGVARMGIVGLGVGSAVAAWVEFFLLQRRLERKAGRSIASGYGLGVGSATALAIAVTVAVRMLTDLPVVLDGIVSGVVVVATYVGALRFQGFRPRSGRRRHPASRPDRR